MVLLGKLLIEIGVKGATKVKTQFKSIARAVTEASTGMKIGLAAAAATVGFALNKAGQDAIKFQAQVAGLRAVAENTGRSFTEVQGAIKQTTVEMKGMATEAELTGAFLKLMGTSLSTDQMKQFVHVVRDGAAAMGEDFATQLELVTRGFKQLNPNVIDNIGINIRMNKLYSNLGKTLGKTRDALSDVEIEQGLLNEITNQGTKFQGVANQAIDTAAGKIALLTAALKDMGIALTTESIEALADMVDASDKVGDSAEKSASKWGNIFGGLIRGVSAWNQKLQISNEIWKDNMGIGEMTQEQLRKAIVGANLELEKSNNLLWKQGQGMKEIAEFEENQKRIKADAEKRANQKLKTDMELKEEQAKKLKQDLIEESNSKRKKILTAETINANRKFAEGVEMVAAADRDAAQAAWERELANAPEGQKELMKIRKELVDLDLEHNKALEQRTNLEETLEEITDPKARVAGQRAFNAASLKAAEIAERIAAAKERESAAWLKTISHAEKMLNLYKEKGLGKLMYGSKSGLTFGQIKGGPNLQGTGTSYQQKLAAFKASQGSSANEIRFIGDS